MGKIRYKKKWLTVLIHALVWVLLFSLPYLLRQASYNADEKPHPEQVDNSVSFIVARLNDLLLIIFFYLNSGVLIPKFFYKKKYTVYTLMLPACFSVFAVLSWIITKNFMHIGRGFTFRQHLPFAIFTFIFILACSIAYKTIRDKVIADRLVKERENENLKTELSLLRMQVSPHFMFNVLNNMVALARKGSDLLEPSLIKLSSLMRYMLYETGEEKVSLEKEIDYLQSYIDLQMQRFGKKLAITSGIGMPDRDYYIEPMLLIPFVENAFKHGTGLLQNPAINILLEAKDNVLHFTVTNNYDAASVEIKDKASGIGLVNVHRRLELLYPENHTLVISKNDNTFTVSLQIKLA